MDPRYFDAGPRDELNDESAVRFAFILAAGAIVAVLVWWLQ